jgi:hypothetical protein
MSEDDLLRRAARALRETGAPGPSDVAMTRARVLDTLRKGERRGRRLVWVLLPVAAVLAGSTALAKSGVGLGRVWHGIATTIGISDLSPKTEQQPSPVRETWEASTVANSAAPAASPPTGSVGPNGGEPDESPSALRATAAPPTSELGSSPPSSLLDGQRRARGAVPRPANDLRRQPRADPEPPSAAIDLDGASGSASPEAEAAALALYKKAHQLHFVEQSYAAALRAWDAYLSTVPSGRLVVEARYNRAIALVRLGRRDEAAAALAPFARGETGGGYRMQEAAALLEALRGTVP